MKGLLVAAAAGSETSFGFGFDSLGRSGSCCEPGCISELLSVNFISPELFELDLDPCPLLLPLDAVLPSSG